MPDGLTLNKIIAQKGISIGEAARRVADHACDYAGYLGVVRAEGGFEVERAPGCFHDVNGVAASVHATLTPAGAGL